MSNKKRKIRKKVILIVLLLIFVFAIFTKFSDLKKQKYNVIEPSSNKEKIKVDDKILKLNNNDLISKMTDQSDIPDELESISNDSIIETSKKNNVIELVTTPYENYNLIPSSGTLIPSFDININEYDLNIPKGIDKLSFAVSGTSNENVHGNEETIINDLETTRNIIINNKEYTVKIHKEAVLTNLSLTDSEIIMDIDDKVKINYMYEPNNIASPSVNWNSGNEEIVEIDSEGTIIAHNYGEASINIFSVDYPEIKTSLKVKVENRKIRSDYYEIKRLSDNYIISYDSEITVEEFLKNINNNTDEISIYKNDDLVTDNNSFISTGMSIVLKRNDEIIDKAYIIIKGDLSPDGMILMNDLNQLKRYLTNEIEFSLIEQIASDIDNDQIISDNDKDLLFKYLTGEITSFKE